MAREDDDLPLTARPAMRDLAPLGIAELEAYIAGLKAEIARAEAVIAAKSRHRSGAEDLFKR